MFMCTICRAAPGGRLRAIQARSEEHTSELQSQSNLVCRLLLEKKKTNVCISTPHALYLTAPTHLTAKATCPGTVRPPPGTSLSSSPARRTYSRRLDPLATTVFA